MNGQGKGNTEALRGHKEASQANTRQELELALARLRNGNPSKVKKDTRITPAAVAQEAGVDRSTLYRFHEPILTQIRKLTEKEPRQQLMAKRNELGDAVAKAKEYRELLENVQDELKAWARQNYALSHKVQEMEEMLRIRDEIIAQLQQQVNARSKIMDLRK